MQEAANFMSSVIQTLIMMMNPSLASLSFPEVPELIAPLIYSIPLQLLAYHVAILKGTDIDQPRNLAKSVTVE